MDIHMSLRSVPLTVTTRGIGVAVVNIVRESHQPRYNPPLSDSDTSDEDEEFIRRRFNDHPPIYALYRASLGLLETKLKLVSAPPFTTISKNKYVNNNLHEYYDMTSWILKVPSPIARIVNAIGVVQCGGKAYHPVVAAPVYYENGKLMPRSENVLLSTLRQTVEALADPATPPRDRTRFKDTCPIPGAVWNDDDILSNPNDIMPPDYKRHIQSNDYSAMFFYSCRYSNNTYLTEKPVDSSLNGRKSLLLSYKLTNIQIKPRKHNDTLYDYYNTTLDVSQIKNDSIDQDMSSPELLSDEEQLEGIYNLLGEVPDFDEQYISYNPRYTINHTYNVEVSDYRILSLMTYELMKSNFLNDRNMRQHSIPLSVTSRGIGFSVVQYTKELINNNNRSFQREIPDDFIYKLYRACLGVFELRAKYNNRVKYPATVILNSKEAYNSSLYSNNKYGVLPKSIMNIINAIGVVEYIDKVYHPEIPAPVYYENGKLMPRSENVLLSTLRQTVEALSDPATPPRDRTRFKDTCPIPGAVWNDDDTLSNPDDIIPQDYKLNEYPSQFIKDLFEVKDFIQFADANLMVPLDEDTNKGGRSMLLSNLLLEMRVSPRHRDEALGVYSTRCRVEGDMSEYFTSPVRLNTTQQVEGLLQLFGEVPPDYQTYYKHIYNTRYQVCHSYGTRIDTQYGNVYTYSKSLEKANNSETVNVDAGRGGDARGGRRRRRGRGRRNQHAQ